MLASRYVSKRPPDGNTITYIPSGPLTSANPEPGAEPFDALKELSPLSIMATVPNVLLVSPRVGETTFEGFIAKARSKPGALFYGMSASSHQISTEMLMQATGIKLTRVSYKGTVGIAAALMSGEVDVGIIDMGSALPAIQKQGVRVLAIASSERSPQAPEVRTSTELGIPQFQSEAWGALFGPPNLPKSISQQLHSAIVRSLKSEFVRSKFLELSYTPRPTTPEQLAQRIREERQIVSRLLANAQQ